MRRRIISRSTGFWTDHAARVADPHPDRARLEGRPRCVQNIGPREDDRPERISVGDLKPGRAAHAFELGFPVAASRLDPERFRPLMCGGRRRRQRVERGDR